LTWVSHVYFVRQVAPKKPKEPQILDKIPCITWTSPSKQPLREGVYSVRQKSWFMVQTVRDLVQATSGSCLRTQSQASNHYDILTRSLFSPPPRKFTALYGVAHLSMGGELGGMGGISNMQSGRAQDSFMLCLTIGHSSGTLHVLQIQFSLIKGVFSNEFSGFSQTLINWGRNDTEIDKPYTTTFTTFHILLNPTRRKLEMQNSIFQNYSVMRSFHYSHHHLGLYFISDWKQSTSIVKTKQPFWGMLYLFCVWN